MKKSLVAVSTVAVVAGSMVALSSAASADTGVTGTFNAISPTRIVDSRSGLGVKTAIAAHKTVTFNAVRAVPGHVADAVALTVTAVDPSRGGHLLVYAPDGSTRPTSSTLSFTSGQVTANEVIAEVSKAGTVSVYNPSRGKLDLLVDITGYWTRSSNKPTAPGALSVVRPARAYNTKTGGHSALSATGAVSVPIEGKAGVPTSGVSAVAVNLTVASPAGSGTLTATAAAGDQRGAPRTATLHFVRGVNRAGLAIVPVSSNGTITIYNSSGKAVNFVADVEGYFLAGTPSASGALVSTTPYRASDTRTTGKPVAAKGTESVSIVPGNASLFKSVVVSITEPSPTSGGRLIVWNGTSKRPVSTTGNHTRGRSTTTTAIVALSAAGAISIYNVSSARVNLVVDVQGYILNSTSNANSPSAARIHQALARARTYSARTIAK